MNIPKHPRISVEDALSRVESKEHPRVKYSDIEARIDKVDYLKHGRMVVCVITMKNGFVVTGESAPADPRNYDEQVGERFAYDTAFRKLWPLEGYLLAERLYEQSQEDDDD